MSAKMFDNLRTVGMHYGRVKNDLRAYAEWMSAFRARVPHWDDRSYMMLAAEQSFADEWVRSGEIVYQLSHSLAALFSLTSSPEIDWEHLPHAAFVVQVPRPYLPLPGTIEPAFSYLYVNGVIQEILVVADHDTTAFSFMRYKNASGIADFFEKLNESRAVKAIQSTYIDREKARPELLERFRNDRMLNGLSQEKLERLIDGLLNVTEAQLEQQKLTAPARVDPFVLGINRLGMRFVANTLAYLSEAQPGSVTPASQDTQRRPRILNMLPPRELVVQRAFRDAAKDAVAATVAGSAVGIKRVLKHHVRGHWRNQAVGPSHSQRRRTWIHPHERGSQDFGTVVRRVETLNVPVEPSTN